MMFMDFVKIFTWKKVVFFFHFQSLRMQFMCGRVAKMH